MYLISNQSVIFVEIILIALLLLAYRKISNRYNIFLALPENRSSHELPTPKGAGFFIALTYMLSITFFSNQVNLVLGQKFELFLIGMLIAAIYGFFDDFEDRGTLPKLSIQIIISFILIYAFLDFFQEIIPFGDIMTGLIILLVWFFFVWFSNAINFMDGIDGMLASGTLIIMSSISMILYLIGVSIEQVTHLLYLLPCLVVFLAFNFSNKKIFLGDSGSLFLGFFISFIFLYSLENHNLNFWICLILLSHFLTETTTTTFIRLFITKDWYKPHKSHAYQNLARILENHNKVTIVAIIYNIFWLLPLALICAKNPYYGPFLFVCSSLPVVILTLKYGPLYSSD
tara:strand:+ start:31419 stop:32447 length:1029 start_codon:yes stop_codon:yes gene_type:complete